MLKPDFLQTFKEELAEPTAAEEHPESDSTHTVSEDDESCTIFTDMEVQAKPDILSKHVQTKPET